MKEENSHIQASKDRFLKIYGMDNKYDAALIRSAMLVNGGAAIALLAFIGSVWSKGLDGPFPPTVIQFTYLLFKWCRPCSCKHVFLLF